MECTSFGKMLDMLNWRGKKEPGCGQYIFSSINEKPKQKL